MEPEPASWPQTLARLLYLAVVLWMVWLSIPEHRRTAWRLAALRTAREACSRAARVTGRAAMRAELSGQGERYGLPFTLAQLAETANTAYDRTRGAL